MANAPLLCLRAGKFASNPVANGNLPVFRLWGGGTCAQCKCIVEGVAVKCCPPKRRHFTNVKQGKAGAYPARLRSSRNMKIEVRKEVFGVKKWKCTVESQPQRCYLHQGTHVKPAEGENVDFRAVVTCSWNAATHP